MFTHFDMAEANGITKKMRLDTNHAVSIYTSTHTRDRAKGEIEKSLEERQTCTTSRVDEQLEGLLTDGRGGPAERA